MCHHSTDKHIQKRQRWRKKEMYVPRQFLPQFTVNVKIFKYIRHRDQRASTNELFRLNENEESRQTESLSVNAAQVTEEKFANSVTLM